ncbi:Histone H2A [Nymphaea thermarum]|nr:Histone H2A [Nymphaea thermarum]
MRNVACWRKSRDIVCRTPAYAPLDAELRGSHASTPSQGPTPASPIFNLKSPLGGCFGPVGQRGRAEKCWSLWLEMENSETGTAKEGKGVGGSKRRGARKKSVSPALKVGLQFPVGRVGRHLNEGTPMPLSRHLNEGTPMPLSTLPMSLSTSQLKCRKNRNHPKTCPSDHEKFGKLLSSITITHGRVLQNIG